VARIVTDAMDGYFMFTQKLTCRLMQPEQVRVCTRKDAWILMWSL
jgi:hypothetical protein